MKFDDRNRPHYTGSEYFENAGMPLHVFVVTSQTEHRQHDHDFTELVVVSEGSGEHVTDRHAYAIEQGDVFVLHGNEKHSYRKTRGLRLYNVIFDMKKLAIPLHDMAQFPGFRALFTMEPRLRARDGFRSRLKLSPPHLAIMINLLENIRNEQKHKRPVYQCMAMSLFLQVAGFLSRCYTDIEDPESRELMQISHVLEYMETAFTESIKLDELAEMASMSKSSFQRAFRRALNTSPGDYLVRIRIRKAAELLARKDILIKQAAAAAGFDDTNYFARQFRKVMGISPTSYRDGTRPEKPAFPRIA